MWSPSTKLYYLIVAYSTKVTKLKATYSQVMSKTHSGLISSSLLKLKKETVLVNKEIIFYNTTHAKVLKVLTNKLFD